MKLLNKGWYRAVALVLRVHARGAVLGAALAMAVCAQCVLTAPVLAAGTTLEWRALSTTPNDQSCKAVLFEEPRAIVIDHDNNIYVTNEKGVNALQKIATNGAITTLIDRTAANVKGQPYVNLSLAIDRTDQIILGVGGRGTIERLTKDGTLMILAGQPGKKGIVDGPAGKAEFKAIAAVAVGPHGDIYIADSRTIRKLSSDGLVSTLAGDEHSKVDYRDGRGRAAAFGSPNGIVIDPSGALYIADGGPRTVERRTDPFGLIRRIDPKGRVTTSAGDVDATGGHLDGTGIDATLSVPPSIALDGAGNVYFPEIGVVQSIREMDPTGKVTTLIYYSDTYEDPPDRDGTAPVFVELAGVTVSLGGDIYVVDSGANKVHRVEHSGLVKTLCTLSAGDHGK